MSIYASTNKNVDPAPYSWTGRSASDSDPDNGGAEWAVEYAPRPGYAEANPVLIAAREEWDSGDPYGSAMAWLIAFQDHTAYDETPDMDNQIEQETRTLVSLRTADGEWDLPRATEAHLTHAERVFDRIVDVCRATGRAY